MSPVGAAAATSAMGGDGTRVMPRQTEVIVEEDDERPPARTSTYIIILAVLLAILGGMLYLLARTLGVGGTSEVVVPRVVGDTQTEAQTKLEDAGLKIEVKSQPDDANEPGRVLGQDPESGARVKKGSTVVVTVSGGAEQVTIPDVVGKQLSDARTILTDASFRVETRDKADDNARQGQVLEQLPKGNEKAGKNSVITLTVSSGREQVNVPSLFNVPEQEAAAELRAAGFQVERTTSTDASVQNGRVIRTDPGAGTPLAKGSTVTIIVSTGAPTTTAPPTTLPPTTVVTIPPTTVGSTTTTRPTTSTT